MTHRKYISEQVRNASFVRDGVTWYYLPQTGATADFKEAVKAAVEFDRLHGEKGHSSAR